MTLATVAADTKSVDQRSRSANKTDRASADAQASTSDQNFGGILSDLSDGSGTATSVGPASEAAGAKILISKPMVDVGVVMPPLASSGHDGAAITALVGKIIGSGATGAVAKTSDTAKVSGKTAIATDQSIPDATPNATQTVLPFDLAALLATPLHASTPSQGIASRTSTKSSAVVDAAPIPGAGAPASVTPSIDDAPPEIAHVSLNTSLAPWTETAAGLSQANNAADPTASIAGFSSMAGPIQTIVDAVTDLAGSPSATASSATAVSTEPALTLAPARTLTLQLTPADLGTVAVRLHLTGDLLDVSLSVSDPKTLGLLGRERDSLSSALGSQSYQLQSLVIQGADASASGENHAGQDHDRGATNGNGNQDTSGGGRGGDQPETRRQDRGAARAGPARVSSDAGTGQLFV